VVFYPALILAPGFVNRFVFVFSVLACFYKTGILPYCGFMFLFTFQLLWLIIPVYSGCKTGRDTKPTVDSL